MSIELKPKAVIEPPICPYCGSTAILADSAMVYGTSYGNMWICPNFPTCNSYVGVHKRTNEPLGRLANEQLRILKRKCHDAFDPIWQQGKMKRNDVYILLAERMGIPKEQCHFGMFDVEQCKEALKAINSIKIEKGW